MAKKERDKIFKPMNKTVSKIIDWSVPAALIISAFLYIFFIIQPELIFHHVQPPFIFSSAYYYPYLKTPGGIAEFLANLILQLFYFRFTGSVVLLTVIFSIWWLNCHIFGMLLKTGLNRFWALIPALLALTITCDYNFPFSVIVSYFFLLLILLFLSKSAKGLISSILFFTIGAFAVYWISGSGYMMLFSVSAVFLSTSLKKWEKAVYILYIVLFAWLIPVVASGYLVAIALKYRYLWLYPPKAWFMRFEPDIFFTLFLISVPLLLIVSIIVSIVKNREQNGEPKMRLRILKYSVTAVSVSCLALLSHYSIYNSDAKKVVKADYFCYHNNTGETAKAATSLKDYNFAANLNYNLVMSKTGNLTDHFFGFFQIKGTEALHPDIEFASELSFIASDFYYDLGFISEAQHWAYESLVFYPYSVRALQNLVKIHLVTGEYKAAERTLKTLQKGLIGHKFISEYLPYVNDTMLIANNAELMEKRSFIPVAKELETTIDGRFRDLLNASSKNKKAYEYLMLFYLLKNDTVQFEELFKTAGNYFQKTPVIYEEALLMHAFRTGQTLPANVKISSETQNRFNGFMQKVEQFKGKTRQARTTLYAEYGKTYMYFLQFVYPNIIDTEIISDEDDYPAI